MCLLKHKVYFRAMPSGEEREQKVLAWSHISSLVLE
jgi:hypothetical protein